MMGWMAALRHLGAKLLLVRKVTMERLLGAVILAAFLGSCSQELTQSDADLLDAVAFVTTSIQDGKELVGGIVKRRVSDKTVVYEEDAPNGDFGSKDASKKDIRGSKFAKFELAFSLPEKCVASAVERIAYSKGDSQEFGSFQQNSVTKYDFNNAHRFEVTHRVIHGGNSILQSTVHLEGKNVECIDT